MPRPITGPYALSAYEMQQHLEKVKESANVIQDMVAMMNNLYVSAGYPLRSRDYDDDRAEKFRWAAEAYRWVGDVMNKEGKEACDLVTRQLEALKTMIRKIQDDARTSAVALKTNSRLEARKKAIAMNPAPQFGPSRGFQGWKKR